MMALLLLAPVLTPLGLVIALWGFRWPPSDWRPYATIVAALSFPLLVLLSLQAIFALPAGSCVERPINNIPMLIAALTIVLAPTIVCLAREQRRFAVGAALALTPLTLFSAPVTMMSLAGCWI